MKITIEQHNEKFTYEGSDYLSTSELIEILYRLCIAVGYHPDSVGSAMYDKGFHEYVKDTQSPAED